MLCNAIPSAMDESEVELQIQLLPNSNLMCAVGYLIQFNGGNKCVTIDSPSVNFTLDSGKEEQVLEGMIYTVDFENRTGQDPCFFSISGEHQ